MYHAQFPDQRMTVHRIFQRLHHQLRETRSFHVTRRDSNRRTAVRSPSIEESILNVVADKSELSTRAHHVNASHQTISECHLHENRLHLFHFQRVQALNPADYLLRLPAGGTAALQLDFIAHVLNSYCKR
ncbi:uncharacterized protein TNCV_1311351 [Trichonephila clavipes]|nr:uncharacterized protein TNCV_1311351 [Trichonephila clavipes]